MKIIWVVRPAEGGILHHLKQLLNGIPDLEIVVVAPAALREWAGDRRFISLDLADGLHLRRDIAPAGSSDDSKTGAGHCACPWSQSGLGYRRSLSAHAASLLFVHRS